MQDACTHSRHVRAVLLLLPCASLHPVTFHSILFSRLLASRVIMDDRGEESNERSPERLLNTARKVGKSPDYEFWTDYEDPNDATIARVYNGAMMLKLLVFGHGVRSPAYGQAGMIHVNGKILLITAKHNHANDDTASFSAATAEIKGPLSYSTSLAAVDASGMKSILCHGHTGNLYYWKYGIDVSLATIKPIDDALMLKHVFETVPSDFDYVSVLYSSKGMWFDCLRFSCAHLRLVISESWDSCGNVRFHRERSHDGK